MVAGGGGMVAMMLRVVCGGPAMVHHVRMGEAVDRVPAMTEGQHGRRATKQSAANAASVTASLKRKPVRSAVNIGYPFPSCRKPSGAGSAPQGRGRSQKALPTGLCWCFAPKAEK